MMQSFFFNNWEGLIRTLIVGVLAYLGLILMLRISGKRTLSKMNAFDFIVTVALGSTLATILLSKDVPLADGLTAFALLIFLQFLITWSSVRSQRVARMIKAEPSLLYFHDNFLDAALRRERVTQGEVRAAVREQGIASLSEVWAVVLETDGSMTVLQKNNDNSATSLQDVKGFEKTAG